MRLARTGVAMFVRLQWLETVGRYEAIFRNSPPTLIAFFAERVPLCKGRWDPTGDTATAYIWLVWVKGAPPRAPFWIPPGRRDALTHPDDVERFTTRPVTKIIHTVIDSQAKADADLVATEGAQAPAAEGMDGTASRLADGRTSDPAEGDVVAPSSSAGEFKDSDAPGCTAASAGGAVMAPAAPPESDSIDIPAFLRRRPDNSLPPRDSSEAA
jgi:hypothetical protein